jgi:glycosyltransferase involved in cell wall biosynthesis
MTTDPPPATGLKVLLRMRSDVERFPGGDYVQLVQTQAALRDLGVTVDVLPGIAPQSPGYDLVHLFNTTRIHETAVQFRQAAAMGVPVVVSTIWHSDTEMRRFYARLYGWPIFPLDTYQALKEAYYARRSRLPILWPAVLRRRALQREVVAGANAVLPNSQAELDILRTELGVQPRAAFIVPNGFSPACQPAPTNVPRRDVLCVGRIEPRKNQLGVIRAFKSLPRGENRLLLYGAMNDSHAAYVANVRAELVQGWVEYVGCVDQTELYAAYSRAAVAVLASFFETCGLVIMEALSCGAGACVTRSPYLEDYYGARVEYCDPYDDGSIAAGLSAALARPVQDHREFLRRFSWAQAGGATHHAYQQVLAGGQTCARATQPTMLSAR